MLGPHQGLARHRAQSRPSGRRDRGRRGRGDPADHARQRRRGGRDVARHLQRPRAPRRRARHPPARRRTRTRAPVTQERIDTATVDVTIDRLAGMRAVFPTAPAISACGSLIDEGSSSGRTLLADAATPPDRDPRAERPARGRRHPRGRGAGTARARGSLRGRIRRDRRRRPRRSRAHHERAAGCREGACGGRAGRPDAARASPALTLHLTCRFRDGTTTAPPAR